MGTWFSQNMNWRLIGFTKLTVFLRYLQYHGVSTAETRQKVEVRYCHRTRETPSAGIAMFGGYRDIGGMNAYENGNWKL